MIFKKKALSPIIATILLVVVSLVLVGILLAWGQNYIQRSTSDADSALERKCISAAITITNCDYNKQSETLRFIIINSGKVDFKEDNLFNLILIDGDGELHNTEVDILDGEPLTIGGSATVKVEDYKDAKTPIQLEIRSSQCQNFSQHAICN